MIFKNILKTEQFNFKTLKNLLNLIFIMKMDLKTKKKLTINFLNKYEIDL